MAKAVPNWMILEEKSAFVYSLPEAHLLNSLLNEDSLLVQHIRTQAILPGRFLANVLFFDPLFVSFWLMPIAGIILNFVPGTEHWTLPQWLTPVLGIPYLLALIATCRWRYFKAFRERHQHVGEKRITLDFKQGELRIEEHIDSMPHRNSCIVLAFNRLRPNIKIHLHDPDSDVDFHDEMRLHLGVPSALNLPDWARWKLDQPIHVCTFDNANERDKTISGKKIQKVLELLMQRLNGHIVTSTVDPKK